MTLKSKLGPLGGLPIIGLVVGIIATSLVAANIRKSTVLAEDENAVCADLAREMQLNVVEAPQWLTDISATRGQDGLNDGKTSNRHTPAEARARGQRLLNPQSHP